MKKVRFFAAVICLALLFNTSFATNYYVSSSGNDGSSGTSESSPWETLSKLDAVDFIAGDKIHFKCGDKWLQQKIVPFS